MAGALAGAALNQAVLRDHQGQPPVGDDLSVDGLAQITNLRQGHFKADGCGGQLQGAQHVHGCGIVDIQAEIPVDFHARFPYGAEKAQISHQRVFDPQFPQRCQILFELGHFPIVDDSRQGHSQPSPLDKPCGHVRVGNQNVQGHIEHGGFGVEKIRGQLLPGGDLNGQAGQLLGPLVIRHRLGLPDGAVFPPCPQGGELVQHVPAHGVDGGGGDNQARVNSGAHLGAAVGGAAGFGYPLGQHFPGEGHVDGPLGPRAGHRAGAALRVGDGEGAAVYGNDSPEFQINKLSLSRFKGLPGGLKPLGIVPGILPGAEHLLIHPAGVVAVGEALPVEGGHQGVHHGPGHLSIVHGLAVHGGDGGNVLGLFHPAFQLHGHNAHGFQLLQIVDETVVLQAQGVFFLPAAIAVALAAGLGAAAPVAGPAADGGGQITLSAVAHTQSAVDKNFNFDGGIGADIPDFLPAQLPAEHHPLQAHGGAKLHPGQGVDGHLGGAVDGNVGSDLAAQLHHAQVLHDKGIDVILGGVADQFRGLLHLPVGH